jgi:peptidoglycan hydrolase CwlO-like protein
MTQKVRTIGLLAALFALTLVFSVPSNAVSSISKNQASKSVTNMKAEISKVKSKIESLKAQKTRDVEDAFSVGGNRAGKLQSDFEALKRELDASRSTTLTRLAQQSVFRVMVDNVSACGSDFQSRCLMNQMMTVPPTSKVDVEFLMKIGAFVPIDESGYKSTKSEIAIIDKSLTDAENKLNSDKAAVQKTYENDVERIFKQYGEESMEAEEYLDLLQKCFKAATRSLKTSGNYPSSFRTAFVFDFNYKSISVVAKTPFSEIDSFISLNVVRNAVQYAGIGDSIDSKYSATRAGTFNKYYGKTFFDEDFEESLKEALGVYKKFSK